MLIEEDFLLKIIYKMALPQLEGPFHFLIVAEFVRNYGELMPNSNKFVRKSPEFVPKKVKLMPSILHDDTSSLNCQQKRLQIKRDFFHV